MTGTFRFALVSAICLGTLAGCSNRDPYKRDDVWYPTGSNAANLAIQVADPADLAGGRGNPKQASTAQVKSVNRVFEDTPKALTGVTGGAGATPVNGAGDAQPPATPPGGR